MRDPVCLAHEWDHSLSLPAKWSLIGDTGEFKIRRKWKQNKIHIATTGPRLNRVENIPCGCKRKKESLPKPIWTDLNNVPSQNYCNWRTWLSRKKGLSESKALTFRRSSHVVQLWIQVSSLSLCILSCVIGCPSQNEQINPSSCHRMSRKPGYCHCGWVRYITLLPDSSMFLQEWI